MSKLNDYTNLDNFNIEKIDTTELDDIIGWFPANGMFDLNIAEQGLVKCLHAENLCQNILIKIDKKISLLETEKSKAWAEAALNKSKIAGHKTAKDKEWYALADDDFIKIQNEISIAKAAKKWFEHKADYFRNWQYAFKTFLKRDYSLEKFGNFSDKWYNIPTEDDRDSEGPNFGGEIEWNDPK